MSGLGHVLRMDRDIPLSEVLDLLDQASLRLSTYAKGTCDLSWNVVAADDLVRQARRYVGRAIKESDCG